MSAPARPLPDGARGDDATRAVRARLAADPNFAREVLVIVNLRAKSPRAAQSALRLIDWPRGATR